MEQAMKSSISYIAVAVALAAGTTAANAQTFITRDQPIETVITQPPVQTVQTTETVQTVRPAPRSVRRQIVTTKRTVTTTTPAPAATIAANPQPLYDRAPLYDTVAPPPMPARTIDDAVINASVGTTIPAYRYVYEPDRILVIDPNTGIAVQALPR
jgi:hypothetical protein